MCFFLYYFNEFWAAVGRLVKLLEKCFETSKKKWVLSKNGLRIAVGRQVKLLVKCFLRQAKKLSVFQKWSYNCCMALS
jgi:hypothetical protein